MTAIARAVTTEWQAIVATAVIGTDRRPLPAATDGWDAWASHEDPAVELLDRAAAVVVARRAGARPGPPVSVGLTSVPDHRVACPAPCARRLQRLLRGEHDHLLPEWFARCATAGVALAWEHLPQLLQRGRRDPSFDAMVRSLAGERARWLAEVLPELGIAPTTRSGHPAAEPLRPPLPPADSHAVATAVVEACRTGAATWAAAPELRQTVAALDPSVLPSLVAALTRLPYQSVTERTRAELVALAEFRHAMFLEFAAARPLGTVDP